MQPLSDINNGAGLEPCTVQLSEGGGGGSAGPRGGGLSLARDSFVMAATVKSGLAADLFSAVISAAAEASESSGGGMKGFTPLYFVVSTQPPGCLFCCSGPQPQLDIDSARVKPKHDEMRCELGR